MPHAMRLLVGLVALTTLSDIGLLAVPSSRDDIHTNVRRIKLPDLDPAPSCPGNGQQCDASSSPSGALFQCCGQGYLTCVKGEFGGFKYCPSGTSCVPFNGIALCQ
jgi:hypothetical protein